MIRSSHTRVRVEHGNSITHSEVDREEDREEGHEDGEENGTEDRRESTARHSAPVVACEATGAPNLHRRHRTAEAGPS
jgi:hypothetical protein